MNSRSFSFFWYPVIVAGWLSIIFLFLMIPKIHQKLVTARLSLTILVPPAMFDEQTFKKFEKESGIALHVAYYENSQSLLSKMRTTGGKDYDLIMPDDHSIELLKQEGLLKKIQPNKIAAWSLIFPQLMGHYFDKTNEYAVPYYLGVYGIGYSTDDFPQGIPLDRWDILFSPGKYTVCMTDEAREAVMLAALHRFGSINALTNKEKLAEIKQVLQQQKKHIETYSIERAASLLKTKSCQLALVLSSEYMRYKTHTPNLGFVIPSSGSLAVIDAFAIPAATQKDELVYALLNFLLRPDVIEHNAALYGYCPARTDVTVLDKEWCTNLIENINRYDFLLNIIPDQEINQLWIDVFA